MAFVARLGEERGALDPGAVIDRILEKMIARHPHVFGDEQAADAEEVLARWEQRKLEEGTNRSLLAGVAGSLPPLVAAYRISQKAAGVGFDWPGPAAVLAKLDEEVAELRAELTPAGDGASDPERVRDEIGDLLFTVVNVARKLEGRPGRGARRNQRQVPPPLRPDRGPPGRAPGRPRRRRARRDGAPVGGSETVRARLKAT